jgi:hypothetical protein
VYVDQDMWEKIVLNLLANACKYTFRGTIRVTLRQTANEVHCSFQDTGVGIPAAELPHMFERFHRVRGTQGRTFEGTGIGLSFVQELVKLHGGTIGVQSALGKGSTFTVALPLGRAHLPPERIVAPRARAATPGTAQLYVEEAFQLLAGEEATSETLLDVSPAALGGPPIRSAAQARAGAETPVARILFADDNADMRAYVRRLLHRYYDVQTVPDGKAQSSACCGRGGSPGSRAGGRHDARHGWI